jgi:hypothetical protein
MTPNKIRVQMVHNLDNCRKPGQRQASKQASKHELGNLRLDAVDDKGGVLALAVVGLGRRKSKGMSQR